MTFGEKVRLLRTRKRLSQQELAKELGLNPRMIGRYESGESCPRTMDGYRKIADFFDVDFNYLITEDEEFVVAVSEEYGGKGRMQAQKLLDGMSALFAGGSLSEGDRDAVMKAMQKIYWDSKARNKEKYTPKKYQLPTEEE